MFSSLCQIGVNDYLFLRDVKVMFMEDNVFSSMGTAYPFRYPCILLRIHNSSAGMAESLKRIPSDHHEPVKIRSRLHRLPQVLEDMKNWKLPPTFQEDPQDLLTRLVDPTVQLNLLKRLKKM